MRCCGCLPKLKTFVVVSQKHLIPKSGVQSSGTHILRSIGARSFVGYSIYGDLVVIDFVIVLTGNDNVSQVLLCSSQHHCLVETVEVQGLDRHGLL